MGNLKLQGAADGITEAIVDCEPMDRVPVATVVREDPSKACKVRVGVSMEDVDALFDGQRAKKDGKAALTFSGLLNALDGVGGSSGQIFVLTTNHRERLDPAR